MSGEDVTGMSHQQQRQLNANVFSYLLTLCCLCLRMVCCSKPGFLAERSAVDPDRRLSDRWSLLACSPAFSPALPLARLVTSRSLARSDQTARNEHHSIEA
jgi:hypothetical protein